MLRDQSPDQHSHLEAPLSRRGTAATMRAWERFVTGESLPAGGVAANVIASWQRSAKCGIAPTVREAPVTAAGDAFVELRWRNREVLNAARQLFTATQDLLVSSQSLMLLTSPDGVVLDAVGNTRTLGHGENVHLMPGADWRELAIGTNAIGTALANRGPVQIHAVEHFCENIKRWTCAAAPVCEPGTGEILGVLDVSGLEPTYHGNNLTLAVAAARQIETMLACLWAQERTRLLEGCLTQLSRSDAAGLIAIDRQGRLVHTTGRVPLKVGLGERVPGFHAGSQIESWAGRLPPELRPEWLNPVVVEGNVIGAMLVIPPPSGLTRPRPVHNRIAHRSSEADPNRSAFAHIEGRSAALQAAIDRARHLVGKRVPVLIEGETGVGKELFARALHGEERRNIPFITFNCAATSRELIGDELFGHVRGAFTGATSEGRAGRFELADGGTLCLDEVGDMPLALQPVLLRALEEGVIYRLGDSQPRHVNVRLLALTNRNLLEEIEAGRFRRDLYHRLSVTRLRIPPLRERDADIELLAERFNRQLAQRHGVAEKRFGLEVMTVLKKYRWPGNVRELRNTIESLVLTTSAGEVAIEDLPVEILAASPAAAATNSATSPIAPEAARLEEFEHLAIVRALESAQGNLTQAARSLGISRGTLYRKVERYHLQSVIKPSDP